ncbi:hypothetical protein ABT160_23205 [Streptomyces sp. NPDC001941]|uniref:hypothetical protein n=1 Tax=Streptomyces sp. NPDC001941 TaxID=3154659 RepID=UPI00332106FB
MTDDAKQAGGQQQEDDQNLWRALYTTDEGWSAGVPFADHLSVSAPALAEVGGTLYCVHRGARRDGGKYECLPLNFSEFTPRAAQPFIDALDEARKPLPEGASAEEVAAWEAKVQEASRALDEARRWSRDEVPFWASVEAPAITAHEGALLLVTTRLEESHGSYRGHLKATHLRPNSEGGLSGYNVGIPGYGSLRIAPAVASYDGSLHVMYVNLASNRITHLIQKKSNEGPGDGSGDELAESPGQSSQGPQTSPVSALHELEDFPHYDLEEFHDHELILDHRFDRREVEDPRRGTLGYPANLALAVHDGKLHLVYRKGSRDPWLYHAVFDGKVWSKPAVLGGTKDEDGYAESAHFSRRNAALASYDGRLHAVYPSAESDKLTHTTWTQEGGWSAPKELDGHDSNNTPALLVVKDGPEGQEHEALLLVHRGIDRYVPPTPPSLDQVASREEVQYGPWVSDEGMGGWSRLRHRTSITPATLTDGRKVLILSWEANAEYYWGFWYYPDHNRYIMPTHLGAGGELWLADSKGAVPDHHAIAMGSHQVDGKGRIRVDAVISRPEPGTYTLYNRYATEKSKPERTGGYYWTTGSHAGHDNDDSHRWCRFHVNARSHATITLT